MLSRAFKIALVIVSGAVSIPALLAAADRSAAYANAQPIVGGERRSLEGLRRSAATELAARRYADAAGDARSVLARQPLDRSALRLLARAEGSLGHDDLADDLTLAATFVSWRDPAAELRMFALSTATGQLDDAARRADAVSRLDGFHRAGFGALNLLLSRPGGTRAVAARLATRPPWRDDYFRDARQGLSAAPQQALPLLRALAGTGAPASPAESDRLLSAVVARGAVGEAWRYWRKSHGGAAGALIDDPDLGAARIVASGEAASPFAWAMPADTSVRLVDHVDAAGRPALRVEARGDRSVLFVARRLFVAPGRYRLSYHASGAADQLERLHPDLRCSATVPVRLQPVGGADATAAIADIPAGCAAPTLGFTIEAGDTSTPTELSIRRVAFARISLGS